MKAAIYNTYGEADVVSVQDMPTPQIGNSEILVKVQSSAVSTADWRLRASAFPGILWLPARLMTGLFKPKNKVLGTDFAGQLVELGQCVSKFSLGDRVYGFCLHGGHAEYLAIDADKAICRIPDALNYDAAAAVPFGALSALVFLRDFAEIKPGQRVLIVGATGGVGVFAVQLAKQMGAEVTGVCSTDNLDLLRSLGADHVIDYKQEDYTAHTETYDVILDTVGGTDFGKCKRALTANGVFIPLEFSVREMMQALVTSVLGGKRVRLGVSGDTAVDLEYLSVLLGRGDIRPVIDGVYPLVKIAEAHRRVEGRHKTGSVVIRVAAGEQSEAKEV